MPSNYESAILAVVSAISGAISAAIPVLISSRAERAKHGAELAEARRRQEAELAEARRRQESELAEARRRHEAEASEARRRHESEASESRRKETRLEERERRLEEMLSQSQNRMADLLAASIKGGGAESSKEQRDQIIDDFGLSVDDEPGETVKEPEVTIDSSGATPSEDGNSASNIIRPIRKDRERGSYILWVRPPLVDKPRYAHFSWGGSAGPQSFKLRDFLGKRLLQHQGASTQPEEGFAVSECTMSRDEVWATARCHKPARGELFHTVQDFPWWEEKLHCLTIEHEQDLGIQNVLDGQNDDRNVLLMLSDKEPPPPREEVRWHAMRCVSHGTTYFATTRILTDMTPERSIVAFYGNLNLFNQFLGFGIFLDYVELATNKGKEILGTHPLYSTEGVPDKMRGFIHLRGVKEVPPGACLESLKGTIFSGGISNGLLLALPNMPMEAAASLQVYFKNQPTTENKQ